MADVTLRHAITPAAEALLRAIDQGTFHDGHGCRHSQEMLAARVRRTGIRCTREHANRCLRQLEHLGLIHAEKPARRGECVTYHAWYWTPSNRNRVIDECRVERARIKRRNAKDHTKGTDGSCRAPSPVAAHPSVPQTRCQHVAREHANTPNDSRRSPMAIHPTPDDAPTANVVHICKGCQALAHENQLLTGELQREREERDIAERQRIRAGRAEQAARNELRAALEADPTSETIHEVIDYWKVACGHPRAKNRLDDARGRAVRTALKHYTKGELFEMIDGLAIAPFTMFGRRKLTGGEDSRRDELEFVLRRDDEVRKLIEIARRAKNATVDAAWIAWQRARAQEQATWTTLVAKIIRAEGAP